MAVWVGAAGGPAGDGEQVVGDGEFVVCLVVGEPVGEGGAGAVVAVGVWEDGEAVACDDFLGFGDGVASGGDADRVGVLVVGEFAEAAVEGERDGGGRSVGLAFVGRPEVGAEWDAFAGLVGVGDVCPDAEQVAAEQAGAFEVEGCLFGDRGVLVAFDAAALDDAMDDACFVACVSVDAHDADFCVESHGVVALVHGLPLSCSVPPRGFRSCRCRAWPLVLWL